MRLPRALERRQVRVRGAAEKRRWTLVYPSEEEPVNSPFFDELPTIGVADLLWFVQDRQILSVLSGIIELTQLRDQQFSPGAANPERLGKLLGRVEAWMSVDPDHEIRQCSVRVQHAVLGARDRDAELLHRAAPDRVHHLGERRAGFGAVHPGRRETRDRSERGVERHMELLRGRSRVLQGGGDFSHVPLGLGIWLAALRLVAGLAAFVAIVILAQPICAFVGIRRGFRRHHELGGAQRSQANESIAP